MISITILRWITIGSFLVWIVRYWQGGKKIIVDIQTSLRLKSSRFDTVTLMVILLCSIGVISTGILASLQLSPIALAENLTATCTGTVFSISGIIGMFYCRHYLGKFWTAETNLLNNHQVIDTGPYHFLRHPIYTFAILMNVGLGLVFLWQWNVVLTSVIVVAYILKTNDEDHYLEQNLVGYQEYKRRVRYRLVSGLW
ncbi:MAG: isoprenylcysteine carboxylmethyltransferase family protein [Anaerolineales bacterium]|nr:isoprenylcysteine carboxylmethyltransferase family protein [Anaerolineales bacterium]